MIHKSANAHCCLYNARVLAVAAELISARKLSFHDVRQAACAFDTYENQEDHEGIVLEGMLQVLFKAIKMSGKVISPHKAVDVINEITQLSTLPNRLQMDEFLHLLAHCEDLAAIRLSSKGAAEKDARRLYHICDFADLLCTDDERRARLLDVRYKWAETQKRLPKRSNLFRKIVETCHVEAKAQKSRTTSFEQLKLRLKHSEQTLVMARNGHPLAAGDSLVRPNSVPTQSLSEAAPRGARGRFGSAKGRHTVSADGVRARALRTQTYTCSELVPDEEVVEVASNLEDLRWEVKAPLSAKSSAVMASLRPPQSRARSATPSKGHRAFTTQGQTLANIRPPTAPLYLPSSDMGDSGKAIDKPSAPRRPNSEQTLLTRDWTKPGKWR